MQSVNRLRLFAYRTQVRPVPYPQGLRPVPVQGLYPFPGAVHRVVIVDLGRRQVLRDPRPDDETARGPRRQGIRVRPAEDLTADGERVVVLLLLVPERVFGVGGRRWDDVGEVENWGPLVMVVVVAPQCQPLPRRWRTRRGGPADAPGPVVGRSRAETGGSRRPGARRGVAEVLVPGGGERVLVELGGDARTSGHVISGVGRRFVASSILVLRFGQSNHPRGLRVNTSD